jgi:Putative transposase of IS4/5 family (DUF4096)
MRNQLYPTDVTDSQWNLIKELIPLAKPGGRPRILDMRQVINALLYVVVGGIIAIFKWVRPGNHNAETTPECLAR